MTNLVGKIFVVLILIASTVFMTMGIMVYSTQHNWYDAITNKGGPGQTPGFKVQLQDARAKAQRLKDEISKYDTALAVEKQTHFAALAKLETEHEPPREIQGRHSKASRSTEQRLGRRSNRVKVAQDNLTALHTEETGLRDDIRQANKVTDEQLKKATDSENRLNIAMGQLNDLKQRNTQLWLDVAKAKLLLSKVGMTMKTLPTASRRRFTAGSKLSTITTMSKSPLAPTTDSGRATR